MSEITEMPVEATIPLPTPDPQREVYVRAAMAYESAKAEREEFIRLLEQAKVAIQVRDNQIETLRGDLAVERTRYDSLQHSYNEALQDRADLEAILATQQAHHEDQAARLAKFEFSRLRRKRNGNKRNGPSDSVPDDAGSAVEVAIGEVVLAHRKEMLG